MKKFITFILTLIILRTVFLDRNDIFYISVKKVFENDKGKIESVLLDNTGRNFSTDKELPAESAIIIGTVINDNYWTNLIHTAAILGLLLACGFALLFGWQFKEFAVAMIALTVCFCCVFTIMKPMSRGTRNAIVKTIENTKGDKIEYRQIKKYCENLSLNEMIELANRADLRYVVRLNNIDDVDSFNKAVAKVYNTSFDIRTTSLRSVHHRLEEETGKMLSFDKKAKQIKEVYKEYSKLEKQNKKLEAKQLKEAAKNGGKKVRDAFEWLFGDN